MGMGLIYCCHTGEYNRRFVGAIRMCGADYAGGMVGFDRGIVVLLAGLGSLNALYLLIFIDTIYKNYKSNK
jgi:hypothetical protein